jgi:thiol-disulfide isomerase/thioredoxin
MTALFVGLVLLSASVHAEPTAQAAAPTQAASQAAAAQRYHVVELYNSDTTTVEALLGVMEKLGATREKAEPILEKVDKNGKAVAVLGSQQACEDAAALFHEIGMKTEVRVLKASDLPSEYDNSDVVVAGTAELNELLEGGEGVLVAFYAPWCQHCKAIVPELKQAATTLKKEGFHVAAVDCEASPAIARQLGIKGYPTIAWLKLEDENLLMAGHRGAGDADSLVRFVQKASQASRAEASSEEPAVAVESEATGSAEAGEAVEAAAATGAAAKSKLGMSKLGKSKVSAEESKATGGVEKAKTPAEAEAAASEPQPAANTEEAA